LNFLPTPFFFTPSPLIPGIVSIAIIFPFIYVHTHYLHYIHPPRPSKCSLVSNKHSLGKCINPQHHRDKWDHT
jgi:hypothetical protein